MKPYFDLVFSLIIDRDEEVAVVWCTISVVL